MKKNGAKVIRIILIAGTVLSVLSFLGRLNWLTTCPDCHKHRKSISADRCASCEAERQERLEEGMQKLFAKYFDEYGNFILETEEEKVTLKYNSKTNLFITSDEAFYHIVSNNPIEKEFVMDEEATTGDILIVIFANKKLWDDQIDFSMNKLQGILDETNYAKLVEARDNYIKYSDTFLKADQHLFYYGCAAGSNMGTLRTGLIAKERSEQFALSLLSIEYELTGSCTFNTEYDSEYEYKGEEYSYMDRSIYYINDGIDLFKARNGFTKDDVSALQNGINSEAATVSKWVKETEAAEINEAVQAYYKYADLMEEIEVSASAGKDIRAKDIKIERLRNFYAELIGMDLSLN